MSRSLTIGIGTYLTLSLGFVQATVRDTPIRPTPSELLAMEVIELTIAELAKTDLLEASRGQIGYVLLHRDVLDRDGRPLADPAGSRMPSLARSGIWTNFGVPVWLTDFFSEGSTELARLRPGDCYIVLQNIEPSMLKAHVSVSGKRGLRLDLKVADSGAGKRVVLLDRSVFTLLD